MSGGSERGVVDGGVAMIPGPGPYHGAGLRPERAAFNLEVTSRKRR